MESAELDHILLQASTDCIKLLDLDARLIWMNGGGCKVLEIEDFSLVANTYWPDFWKGTDGDAARTAIEAAKAGGVGHFQGHCPTWKGTPKWWDVVVTLVLGAQGKPEWLMAVSRDITELTQANDRLRESEARFRNMADTAPAMIWVVGVDKLCTFFNKPWLDFTGRTMEQELGYGWAEGVHPEDVDRNSVIFHSAFDSRSPFQKECRLRRADGEYRWVLDHGTPLYRGGEFIGYIGSCIDITDQKLIEERLRASEARLMYAQRLTKVGSWERQIDTGRTYWSDEIYRIFGLSKDAPSGFSAFLSRVHPEDRENVLETERQVRSADAPAEIEYRIIRPNGEVRFLHSVVEAIRNQEGVPICLAGATQDITESKRTQEEILTGQKMESLGLLASGVAHDFNNLLGGILVSAEILLTTSEEAAVQTEKEEILRIRTAAIRGGEIVQQLMVYGGEGVEGYEPVNLSRLVGEMLTLLKASISKRAELKVDLPNRLLPVRANAAQIRQVVMNLITNASDSLEDKDGVISIRVSPAVRLGQASGVSHSGDGHYIDYMNLEVSDTGCGMTEEIKAKIYDPFFTTKFAGHGLGLAAVQGIIRAHGGIINVASWPGQGSRFEILLPCHNGLSQQSGTMAVSAEDHAVHAGTVLVVEDEDLLRLAVSKHLRREGFTVIEAADGNAAVDLFKTNASGVHVVLLDVTLPGMACREILRQLETVDPAVKVIITSAYSEESSLAAMGGQRRWPFIRKPYTLGALKDLLRQACYADARWRAAQRDA
jgi:two-component system, cell cycle sensor histidine kinase and response regulator CckA